MPDQARNATLTEHDDGVKSEDLFRRAAFGWALSTKRLVDASRLLSKNSKVTYPALADIEYARELLDKLFLPIAVKVPAVYEDSINALTPELVRASVSDLVSRMDVVVPEQPQVVKLNGWHQEESPKPLQAHRGVDLSAPVWPKKGKMLWAGVHCNYCGADPGQRCKKDDGGFIEKPHPSRKNVAEVA